MSHVVALADWPSSEPILRLPHPYQTPYYAVAAPSSSSSSPTASASTALYQLTTAPSTTTKTPPEPLHNDSLYFSEPTGLKSSERPAESNNTAWARARRSPAVRVEWTADQAPSLAQAWLVVYALFTIRHEDEFIRLSLSGTGKETLSSQLRACMLAVLHPSFSSSSSLDNTNGHDTAAITSTTAANPPQQQQQQQQQEEEEEEEELVLLRASFWQGAGSPFGARSVWVPTDGPGTTYASQGVPALDYMLTNNPGVSLVWHPRRAPKPRPGSTLYSRWIPHLKENFSMVALDHTDEAHVGLFHTWLNDPRVSQGWDQAGTLEGHREYLRRIHDDPHQFAVLAAFDGVFFAYFEIYWAREDKLGAYYRGEDFDRGRHSLVGDVRYRGAHRVGAWWSSLIHYLFLDDPRTMQVVGEPKFTNTTVLAYDLVHGFGVDKFVDLPSKRSTLMRCSRERFFQICPLAEDERGRKRVVAGTQVGLVPKL